MENYTGLVAMDVVYTSDSLLKFRIRGYCMRKACWITCVCLGLLASGSAACTAQELIHALTGTVTAINATTGTISVLQDNGQSGVYETKSHSNTRISFDKRVAADTTAATAFNQQNAYVVVFYYGQEDRTVVALKDLGKGPFTAASGTVEKVDSHAHSISVKDSAGAEQTFALTAQSVVESNVGAVDGGHFQPQKGDHVRIVAGVVNGAPTALFVRDN